MAGRSASNTITRYAGIQVQTSALGLNVPVGWGTFRCKCNLVDYLDFKSKAQKAAASKGGTTTGYSYTATVILALCEGPIDSVSTIYVDGKVYKNGAKTALSQANLNLHTGAIGQAVWGYLTSNHAAHAIGYSGLAIAYQSNYALDSGAQTPNHSFEVVRTSSYGVTGSPDADPSLVVADFFTNSRYGVPSWAPGLLGDLAQYQDYCLAAGLLVSPVIDSQRSASDFLTELLKGTNSTCVWSEGLLKFIPYGDTPLSGNGRTYTPNNTPVYSLGDDDYIPQSVGDDPLTIDIEDQSDAYNVVQLEYLDRTNEYNMAIALASDAANVAQYGMRRKDPDTVHCIATPAVAALSAQLYLQRTLYIRSQFKFTLGWQFALLEPGDILELTDTGLGLSAYPVRIIQIDDDEDACRAITAEDFPVGVSHAPLYTMQEGGAPSRDTNIDPGGVEANLALWSGDQTNAAYTQTNVTITGASANDQYGLPTACTIVPTAVSGAHQISQAVSAPLIFAETNYTFSVCLQAGAHHLVQVRIGDGNGNGQSIFVDLSAGAITGYLADGVAGNNVLIGADVFPTLVSGIWQVCLTVQAVAPAAMNPSVGVLDASGNTTWTGDGSNAVYVSQWALRQGVDPGAYAATTSNRAGPVIFNPPAALNDGGSTMFAAVAGGPNWGGCNVWVSIDGTDFNEIGQITAPARYGLLTAAFPSHADPDTADMLSVDLGWSGGSLSGASTASVDNGATTSWINGELVGFAAATLTNPSRYNLGTYIRRGFQNTPISAHNPGDPFVRLDEAIFDFPYLDINSGETVYLKFQSFNIYGAGLQSLADCLTYSAVPNPVAANAPGAAAWTAAAASLSAAGVVVPVLEITGAIDNPAATSMLTFSRVHGTTPWQPGGTFADGSTVMYLPTVVSGQAYDVGIAYVINGIQTGVTQIGTDITVASAVVPGIVGQAAAATDPTIQSGATRNITTYAGTAPSSPANGDIWVDTGVTPNITYLRAGGAWQVAANYVTSTSDIVDGAGLGKTAVWSSVSATPANLAALSGTEAINNATLQAALTAGSVVPLTASGIPASGVSGLAPAATDPTIQSGATYNEVFVSTTDPSLSGPVPDGAFWYNPTSGQFLVRHGSAWTVVNGYADGSLIYSVNAGPSDVSWSFTIPSTAFGFATVVITGGDGGGNAANNAAGGSGATVSYHFAVTPGSTTLSGVAGAYGATPVSPPLHASGTSGDLTTCTSSAFTGTMTAGGGVGASGLGTGAPGTGGSATGPSGATLTSGTTGGSAGGVGGSGAPGTVRIYTHVS